MAQLLNIFPGSAVSLWNTFDDIFIRSIVDETLKIKKREQDYIDEQTKNPKSTNNDDDWFEKSKYSNSYHAGGKISCSDLEDIPATEAEQKAMDDWIRENNIKVLI